MDQDQFAAYLALAGYADNTIRIYRAMLLRWADHAVTVGADPWRPDPTTVRSWASNLPGSRSTRAHARATIGHLCDALDVDDVSGAIPLPRQPKRQMPLLDADEAARLVAHARGAGLKGLAVLVGLYTAARRSEIASLAWHRIDTDAGSITLWRTKTRDFHTVPLHPQLAVLLEERRTDERWVFPGPWGGHVTPTTIWQWTLDVSAAAGVGRVTPHTLRRTALTLANDTTGDLRAVQDLAGHTDPAVTARYTRTSRDALARAVAALDYDDRDEAA
jgi:integrase